MQYKNTDIVLRTLPCSIPHFHWISFVAYNGEMSVEQESAIVTTQLDGVMEVGTNSQEQQIESTAEVASNGTEGEGNRPLFFFWIPRCFRFDKAPTEATGLTLNCWARGHVFVTAVFIGPALLSLANDAAVENCPVNDDAYCQNHVKVHGFLPSSLLTNIATVSGLIGSISLPILGAIVDHTSYRRHVGFVTAAVMTSIMGVSIGLTSRTWFAIAVLQAVAGVAYQIHCVAVYSYASELSKNPEEQSNFQSYYYLVLFTSMLALLIEVLIPGTILNTDNVDTGRLAAGICTVVVLPIFVIAWKFFIFNRDPLEDLPPGETLWTIGFTKLYRTFKVLQKDLPTVTWFLRGITFSEAADSALPIIATTYMAEFLKMSALEIGAVILLVLLAGAPGSRIGNAISIRYNPVTSAKCAVTLYVITTTLATFTLLPSHKYLAFLYGPMWGISVGWMHPQHATIFITITPKGQNVELMGLFLFAVFVLNFLPPLIFTILNQAGVAMNWSLCSLNLFFVLGLMGLFCLGDYDMARERVVLLEAHRQQLLDGKEDHKAQTHDGNDVQASNDRNGNEDVDAPFRGTLLESDKNVEVVAPTKIRISDDDGDAVDATEPYSASSDGPDEEHL